MPGYAYDEAQFFAADGAPDDVAAQRRAALRRLGAEFDARFAKTLAATEQARETISDLRFTGRYRVPFHGGLVQRRAPVEVGHLAKKKREEIGGKIASAAK